MSPRRSRRSRTSKEPHRRSPPSPRKCIKTTKRSASSMVQPLASRWTPSRKSAPLSRSDRPCLFLATNPAGRRQRSSTLRTRGSRAMPTTTLAQVSMPTLPTSQTTSSRAPLRARSGQTWRGTTSYTETCPSHPSRTPPTSITLHRPSTLPRCTSLRRCLLRQGGALCQEPTARPPTSP